MGKVVDFNPPDAAIEIEKGGEYLASAQRVSDFILSLPLSREQNDRLIKELAEHMRVARRDAWMQGAAVVSHLWGRCNEGDE